MYLSIVISAQSDTTIVVDFSKAYVVNGFDYKSAECSVDVHGGGLYSITYQLAGPDTIGGVGVVRYNTIREYKMISGAVALNVLDAIKSDLDSQSSILQSKYQRSNTLSVRYFEQNQDIQAIRATFIKLKTWAQSQ